jgi:O-antigen/teichoic acid export membrane protein
VRSRAISRVRNKFKYISLTPFDTSSETGRSDERHRRITLTALASSSAKAITIITSFITVPLTLNYLGTERYGLWMTISSVISMMVFSDFGIGNGLMNAVAEAYGKDDKEALKRHIANAAVILGSIATVIVVLFLSTYSLVEWGIFFNVKSPLAIQESGSALGVFVCCFALGLPAGIVQRVQMGLQQGFASSLWQAGGSILGLLLTLLVIYLKAGLPWLVLALGSAPIVALALNGIVFFFYQRRDLIPNILQISKPGMKQILNRGLLFFVLQLAVAVAYASDNIIIARNLGAAFVSQYSVVSKLFEGLLTIQGLMIMPLWPAYGEAKARNDNAWIKKTLSISVTITLSVIIPTALILVLFNRNIFDLWIGPDHIVSLSLVTWYGVWFIVKGVGATYSMFFNGMHILRFQVVLVTIFMVISILAKLYFINRLGLPGLLIGLIISYLLSNLIPSIFFIKKYFRI